MGCIIVHLKKSRISPWNGFDEQVDVLVFKDMFHSLVYGHLFDTGNLQGFHLDGILCLLYTSFIDTFVYEGLGTKDQTGPMLYDSFWGEFEEQISACIYGSK